MRIFIPTVLALMAFVQANPRPANPAEFLRKAVVEGLKEDGADPAFVKERIADKGELFVLKCRICDSVRKGFTEYAYAKPAEPAKGKGIPMDIADDLKSATRVTRLKAVERLVDRYVSSHYERLKISAAERQAMNAALEDWKKEGMKMKELGPQKDFGDFCPSCNGAAKAK